MSAFTPQTGGQPRSFSVAHGVVALVASLLSSCSTLAPPNAALSGDKLVQPAFAAGDVLIEAGDLKFADLNRDGALEAYEDWRLSAAARTNDLLARMTLDEKAGTLMHGTLPTGAPLGTAGGGYDMAAFVFLNRQAHITSAISRLSETPRRLAEQNNAIQASARQARLGIPVTISTDPRNHFQIVEGASVQTGGFSQWPETLGLAAIGDPDLTRTFARIAAAEYRAVGIQMALSPQADIASEPRWSRINGTFGDDPALVGRMVGAYVEGFQNGSDGLNRDSVITVVKHWVGYGAAVEGWDGHNYYGRFARLTNTSFQDHIAPFLPAFAAHVAGVMPTYSILQGVTWEGRPLEGVGAGFDSILLTDILRRRYGFDGVVLSDWAIMKDCNDVCRTGVSPQTPPEIAMSWGVDNLTVTQRFARGLNAGLDQFGGADETEELVKAVQTGLVTEARIDQSVRRVLIQKFELGLFDNPFVDPSAAERVVGAPGSQALADEAQRHAMVLLKADLPSIAPGTRVWLRGVSADAARFSGLTPVDTLAQAQVAVIRTAAPFETLHPNYFFGGRQHEGSLEFPETNADLVAIRQASAAVPTIVSVYLDRPAILTKIAPLASSLIGEFGASDAALLDVVMGKAVARGRLPFALPRDMASVIDQVPGEPDDLAHPLYARGFGLQTRR